MNYKESINWINSFEKFGIKLGLERIKYLCEKIGNPQNNFDIIHVGGTNGKGSVCKFLQSILTIGGYKTGLYTSPHLQRFSERFVIDGKEISESDIVKLVDKIKPIVEDMVQKDNIPTFFEITTTLAFLYFSQKKVDYGIIEVGLGGRFDATNIVLPKLTIITNVSLEHQDRLGNTIEEIAFEKAGIIKEKVTCITGATNKALKVIKKVANKKNAQIINDIKWEKNSSRIDYQDFLIHGSLKDYNVKTNSPGTFQGQNIAISIKAIEFLQMNGVYITDEAIIKSIEKTTIPGRMEIVAYEPIILLDGAHNIDGIKSLKNTLEKDFIFERLILVVGILADKKVKEILEIISPIADIIIVTKSNNPRASNPSRLKDMIESKNVIIKQKISDAINYSLKIAKKQDLILITGSLFTVGETRDFFKL